MSHPGYLHHILSSSSYICRVVHMLITARMSHPGCSYHVSSYTSVHTLIIAGTSYLDTHTNKYHVAQRNELSEVT